MESASALRVPKTLPHPAIQRTQKIQARANQLRGCECEVCASQTKPEGCYTKDTANPGSCQKTVCDEGKAWEAYDGCVTIAAETPPCADGMSIPTERLPDDINGCVCDNGAETADCTCGASMTERDGKCQCVACTEDTSASCYTKDTENPGTCKQTSCGKEEEWTAAVGCQIADV